jgi:hypothetical protein
MSSTIKTTRREFRKNLINKLRQNLLPNGKLHLVGSKGNWNLVAKVGTSIYLLKPGFPTQGAASIHSMKKFSRKATVLKLVA